MSSFLKQQLKTAKQAIQDQNYEYSKAICEQILENVDNYNALVFLGLSELKLNNHHQSQTAYQKAAKLSPEQALAFQGLVQLYNIMGNLKLEIKALQELERIYFSQ